MKIDSTPNRQNGEEINRVNGSSLGTKNDPGIDLSGIKDLARSELMARFIALIYNWWSIYIKLVDEQVAREAITSRPMYLEHVAKVSTHQSTQTLVVFCAQA